MLFLLKNGNHFSVGSDTPLKLLFQAVNRSARAHIPDSRKMNNRGWYGWSVEMLGLSTQSRKIQGQMKRCHFLGNVSSCHSYVKEFEASSECASLCIWTGITDSCLLNTELFSHNPSHIILACRMRGNHYLFWINPDLNFLLPLYATFKDFKHIPSECCHCQAVLQKETGVGE